MGELFALDHGEGTLTSKDWEKLSMAQWEGQGLEGRDEQTWQAS